MQTVCYMHTGTTVPAVACVWCVNTRTHLCTLAPFRFVPAEEGEEYFLVNITRMDIIFKGNEPLDDDQVEKKTAQ